MMPAMRVFALAMLGLSCDAVRKQAGRFVPEAPGTVARVQSYSKSVALAPGMDGRLRALTREMRTSQLGDGEAAEVAAIIEDCVDGDCEESRLTSGPGAQRRSQTHDWVADFFRGDDAEVLNAPVQFGLDELGEGGSRVVSHLGFKGVNPTSGAIEWDDIANPFVSQSMAVPPRVDSVTRSVKVTEEQNGQRHRTEVVTRCRDSKCASEVVQGDGSTATMATHQEGVAPAASSACAQPSIVDPERLLGYVEAAKRDMGRLTLGLYLAALACATETGDLATTPAWAGEAIKATEVDLAGRHVPVAGVNAWKDSSGEWATAWHRDQAKLMEEGSPVADAAMARATEIHELRQARATHPHMHGI